MNSNLFHNILNAIGWITGLLTSIATFAGCTLNPVNGVLDCTGSTIVPAWLIPWMTLATVIIFSIKGVINVTRDGFAGLGKQQPPVASDVKTVVVTGDKDSITEVKIESPSGGKTPAKVM
jgi:hypothetical protein